MIDHGGIRVADMAAAIGFHDATLEALGYRRVMDFGDVIGYGDEQPAFWIGPWEDQIPKFS